MEYQRGSKHQCSHVLKARSYRVLKARVQALLGGLTFVAKNDRYRSVLNAHLPKQFFFFQASCDVLGHVAVMVNRLPEWPSLNRGHWYLTCASCKQGILSGEQPVRRISLVTKTSSHKCIVFTA